IARLRKLLRRKLRRAFGCQRQPIARSRLMVVREREEIVDELLLKEAVEVERVIINREVDAPVPVRYEGETMIVPVLEEMLVVEKRLVLKEE
ncbi:MAG: YsnF/AvaK domain-containing protein, partial [Acidobacteria bacterium]|nr:YsnF/AvaK domain-containing protein [Acidobacteriota bacterium]